MDFAFEFIINNGGIDTEDDYPYTVRWADREASHRRGHACAEHQAADCMQRWCLLQAVLASLTDPCVCPACYEFHRANSALAAPHPAGRGGAVPGEQAGPPCRDHR